MADHLSWLDIDEVVAGDRPAPPHVADCSTCRDRLAQATAARKDALASFAFHRVRRQLESRGARPSRWAAAWPVLGAALAAALVIFLRAPTAGPVDLLKGAASVRLLDAATEQPVVRAHPGDKVLLAVSSAGHAKARIFTVDARGTVASLWPKPGQACDVGPAVAPLASFAVTPGDVELFAFFSEAELDEAAVHDALSAAVAQALAGGQRAFDARPRTLVGEAARAQRHLGVDPP